MDEDIQHLLRKKRGAPSKKTFSKPTNETVSTTSTNQNPNDMADDNEFYNMIGNEKEVRNPSTPPKEEPKIKVEATVINENDTPPDTKSKAFVDPLLDEPVAKKDYAAGLTDTSKIPTGDIPEAQFAPLTDIGNTAPPEKAQQIPKAEPIQPLNKDAETLSPAEKRRGAELTVEGFWSGYDKLNFLLGSWLQTSPAKRVAMHNKKELDLNMRVKVSVDGTTVTVNEFYDQLNEDIKDTFTVDNKLKEKLWEPMCREAEKMGLVMTDRQFILKELGQDIITKLMQFMSINNQLRSFTKSMKEAFAEHKKDMAESEAKAQAREERMSRMIDPDSEEGQQQLYQYYLKIKGLELSAEEKARRMHEHFKEPDIQQNTQQQTVVQQPAQQPVVQPTVTVQQPVEEQKTSTDIMVHVEEVKDEDDKQ